MQGLKINIIHTCFLMLCGIFLLAACSKDDRNNLITDASVGIASFKLAGVTGSIDEKAGEITVQVPFGIDIENLNPEIVLPTGARISPGIDEVHNFTGTVQYTVFNGNLYKDYRVKAIIQPPFTDFKIGETSGNINHSGKSVSFLLPDGQAVDALTVHIGLAEGVTASPASGAVVDFTAPVQFTFSAKGVNTVYTVSAISNSVFETAFLGTAPSRDQISNPDEKAAADWFFGNYPESDYLSFQSIETGIRLTNYKVIWWHFATQMDIPAEATKSEVTNALKAYRAQGGSLLLTGMASRYVEQLGVVPADHGPNNVWGDFGNAGFVTGDSWGISFRGRESHPIFQGLTEFDAGKAFLLGGNTHRQNQGSWWFLGEWAGDKYSNAAQWRNVTNGVNLASEQWDDNLDGRVAIAEWPNDGNQGNVLVIGAPSYDWYLLPAAGASTTNPFLGNMHRLTQNIIDYLKQ